MSENGFQLMSNWRENMKGIIPTGGIGSRFYQITLSLSKHAITPEFWNNSPPLKTICPVINQLEYSE
jgi:hypothetical protein